jgi:hypothetical protein
MRASTQNNHRNSDCNGNRRITNRSALVTVTPTRALVLGIHEERVLRLLLVRQAADFSQALSGHIDVDCQTFSSEPE